jgi:ankyrin repeat protein
MNAAGIQAGFFHALEGADLSKARNLLRQHPELATLPFPKTLGTNPPLFMAVRVPGHDGHGERIAADVRKDSTRAKIVALLIAAGADPNFAYKRKVRPLHMAARYGPAACVDALLAAGAEVNAVNSEWETALFRAANLGHAKVVVRLLSHGADPNIPNKHGDTPWERAKDKRFVRIVAMLECARGSMRPG